MVESLNKVSREFLRVLDENKVRGYALTLEFENLDKKINSTAKFSQADYKTSFIALHLTMKNKPINLEAKGLIVYANILKPDGEMVTNDCSILDAAQGVVLLGLKTNSIDIEGTYELEIVVKIAEEGVIVSPLIIYTVYPSFEVVSSTPSENEIPIIKKLIDDTVITDDKTWSSFKTKTMIEILSKESEGIRIVTTEVQRDKLENVINGMLCYVEDMDLYFKYKDGFWEEFKSGSGDGGIVSEVILETSLNSELKTALGQTFNITYNYSSTSEKAGKAVYKVNNVTVVTNKIDIGSVTFDISPYLKKGTNEVLIEVTDVYGAGDFLSFNIDVIELELTSNFDYKNIYKDTIPFNYNAIGNVSKTVHFLVDGVEVGTEIVNSSNVQKIYNIQKQNHGSHKIEVYATCELNGETINSNKLIYEVICVEEGNNTTVIASSFNQVSAEQYSLISIPYMVYTPNSLESQITLKINEVEKSTLVVDRDEHKWNTTDYPHGQVVFTILCGDVRRDFNINVTEVGITFEEEIENLDLHLTSLNRSNNDSNKEIWQSNNIVAQLNGFNWKTNGWLFDKDDLSVMRITDGASIEIPIKPFDSDFKLMGKTIEFEFLVSDVVDYNTSIISCISGDRGFNVTPKSATFKTNELTINTDFKDDERIRISFVIEDVGKNRLIYTYVNGIISGLSKYTLNDIFTQTNPVNILLGSNKCTLDIYNIRIYSRGLSTSGVLNNFIYDMSNTEQKIALYNNNRIFDSYGEILYSRILDQVPCMTITGELPSVKGDKKKVVIEYEDKTDKSKNFKNSDVTLNIQGTSSQYYPKKNYKFKLTQEYKLREDSIAEKTFCIKADYMESSHSFNTGMAKLVHSFYSEKVPPQEVDSKIRTTIDGFPMALFYKENESDTPKYFGVYNFNNDKSNVKTFGYKEGAESWELLNNTSDRCLFKESDYERIDETTGDPEWLLDFEARYPEDNTDFTNLKRLTDWIVSTKNDKNKFKAEFSQYFNKHYVLVYYIITEFFAMVDSRAKNMFLSTWDGNIWYPIFYDMDTINGLNNEGVNIFNYNVESTDTIGSLNVFNGKDSLLWQNVASVFADEIEALYKSMRDSKKLTYEKVLDVFIGEQIGKICESQYNADAQYKYLDPLINENIETYLYIAQGSRVNHLKYWLYNRFNYMDSKYISSAYKANYATFRLYTPSNWNGVKPNANFEITPFTDQYLNVKYGSYDKYTRANANTPTTIQAPDIVFNDTETIIYGADSILSLGDLSDKYAGTVDVSKATKLTELILGSNIQGYTNTNLHNVSIGNNKLLRKLDISNCPNVSNVLDLSNCPSVEEVYLKGTSVSFVNLSSGANLKKMHLPNSIVNLELINKTNLSELTFEGYDKINIFKFENSSVNPLSILINCKNVELVRLTNINCKTNYISLNFLKRCKGIDERGIEVPISEAVTGKVVIAKCSEEMLNEYREFFPHIEFTVEEFIGTYTVTFKDGDGNTVYEEKVIEGGEAVYLGDTPTKTSTDQYDFVFNGWNRPLKPITSDTIINATFDNVLRSYTIRFINPDTDEVLSSQYLEYGSLPVEPTIPEGFNSWSERVSSVTGDKDYIAITQPMPDDMSIFTFSTTTIDGISGYECTLVDLSTYPSFLVVPFKYNDKPVISFKAKSNTKSSIKEIYLPNELITIGQYAFYNCTALTSITIPNGVTSLGESCFYNCTSLTSITIPNSIISLGSYCFENCSNLTTIEIFDNVTSLGRYCFYKCTALTSITIPNSVTSLGDYCFSYCSSLTTITLSNNLTSLSKKCFYNCTALTSITIPNSVTSLGSYCFENCSNLTTIEIPNGVTSLGEFCFHCCSKFTKIEIPNSVTSIGKNCFSKCVELNSIKLPNSLNIIPSGCFYACSSLVSVEVPEFVTTLDNGCFSCCTGLTSLILPEGLQYIKYGTFYFNTGSSTSGSALESCRSLTSINIPSSIKELCTKCFTDCNNLVSVKIGDIGKPISDTSGWEANVFTSTQETMDIYTATGDSTGIVGQPWGATSATITYRQA